MQRTFAKFLFVLAVPIVFVGLIDPLEGGIALVVAAVVYAVGFLLVRKPPEKSLWIPFLLAIVVGAVTLVLAITTLEQRRYQPLNPVLIVGIWSYRVAVAATLVGAAVNAFKFLTNRR